MEKEVRVQLGTPIKCGSPSGEFKEYCEVVIMPPRARDDSLAWDLGSEFSRARVRAMAELSKVDIENAKKEKEEEKEEESSDKMTNEAVSEILLTGGADYKKLAKSTKALLSAGSIEKPQCYFDGEDKVKMTETLFNEIAIKDKNKIIGEYIANFL